MGNLTSRVSICCGGDKQIKTDFRKVLSSILKMDSVESVLNGEEENLFRLISVIVRYIKFYPIFWETEVKREFIDCLLEMASDPGWGGGINREAEEALLELSLTTPPILKKTKKEDKWFDLKQIDYLLDLWERRGDYRSREARKALCS